MDKIFESFEIKELYGYKNVSLKFSDKTTIFVGENGVGKTTILIMFYYLLNGNYKELSKYNFNSIKFKFANVDEIEFSKDDLLDYVDSPQADEIVRKYFFGRREHIDFERVIRSKRLLERRGVKGIGKWLEDIDNSILDRVEDAKKWEELDLEILFNQNTNSRIPKNYFFYSLAHYYDETHIQHSDMDTWNSFGKLSRKLDEIRKENKILYFPTYRRIEESLFNKEDLDKLPFREEIKAHLINFGMGDVEKQIEKILNEIKTATSRNYEQMTSGLLNQYTDENVFAFSHLDKIESETLRIALERLGNEVSEATIDTIINKFVNNEFSADNDKYLLNLLDKIVENYLELSQTDEKINSFVKIVNKYLVNKWYVYNKSSLDLEIYDKNNREIKLSQLSSGEKQIVSIFSKIILEDKKKIIALFDEPELSLSIEWQKEFLVDISNSENISFLMAVTHSPYIFENLLDNALEIEVGLNDTMPYVDEEFIND